MPRTPASTRRDLLLTAAREFLARGYEATGILSLVTATGLTKGALFHHFAGKEALAIAVIDEILEPAIEHRWLDPLAHSTNPVDTLRQILQSAEVDLTRADPSTVPGPLSPLAPWLAIAADLAPQLHRRVATAHDRWLDAIADALRRGLADGTVHRAIVPANEAHFLLTWFHGASLTLAHRSVRPTADAAGLFQAAFAYLETLRPAAA